jgi:hypothetical protein
VEAKKTNVDALLDAALQAIRETATLLTFTSEMLNERYVHHYFSHRMQESLRKAKPLDFRNDTQLHPEWPTFKQSTGIDCAAYRNVNGKYWPQDLPKSRGWIDFALGDYKRPRIAVEFTLKYGWGHEDVVYDYLKMLDGRLPFESRISLNLVLRTNSLVSGGNLKRLVGRMNDAYTDALDRLGEKVIHDKGQAIFIVSEIEASGHRRHWHYAANPDFSHP